MATFGPVAIGSGRCEEVAIVESFFCLPGQKKEAVEERWPLGKV